MPLQRHGRRQAGHPGSARPRHRRAPRSRTRPRTPTAAARPRRRACVEERRVAERLLRLHRRRSRAARVSANANENRLPGALHDVCDALREQRAEAASATAGRRRRRAARTRPASAARSVARPAATASGFPLQRAGLVDRAERGEQSMTSARPPSAASGIPPPMTLPNVIRSGVGSQAAAPDGLEAPPAGGPDAEAGEHLVEDQQRAVRVRRSRRARR